RAGRTQGRRVADDARRAPELRQGGEEREPTRDVTGEEQCALPLLERRLEILQSLDPDQPTEAATLQAPVEMSFERLAHAELRGSPPPLLHVRPRELERPPDVVVQPERPRQAPVADPAEPARHGVRLPERKVRRA